MRIDIKKQVSQLSKEMESLSSHDIAMRLSMLVKAYYEHQAFRRFLIPYEIFVPVYGNSEFLAVKERFAEYGFEISAEAGSHDEWRVLGASVTRQGKVTAVFADDDSIQLSTKKLIHPSHALQSATLEMFVTRLLMI